MKHQSPATLTALLFLSLLLVTESPRYLQDKSTSTLQQQKSPGHPKRSHPYGHPGTRHRNSSERMVP